MSTRRSYDSYVLPVRRKPTKFSRHQPCSTSSTFFHHNRKVSFDGIHSLAYLTHFIRQVELHNQSSEMNSQSGLKRFRNQPSSQSTMIGAMMLLVVSSVSVQAFAPSSTTYPHYFGVAKATTHSENEQSSKDAVLSYTQISSKVFGAASLAYADGRTSPSRQMSDFQRRMLNIIGNEPNSPYRTEKGKSPKQPSSQKPKNVEQVLTLQDYKSVVGDETEKLVVVRFYAPWCKPLCCGFVFVFWSIWLPVLAMVLAIASTPTTDDFSLISKFRRFYYIGEPDVGNDVLMTLELGRA
eukprot:scaffold42485_cov50-Attheya_sp.AAC.13